MEVWHGTTIIGVRKNGKVVVAGDGQVSLQSTVISRESLENIAERFLSCAPLRCMMFLNLEWPAMASFRSRLNSRFGGPLAA